MSDRLARAARWFSLIGGSVFGVIGVVWSFVFIDRGTEELKVLTDRKAGMTREIQALESNAYNYFIANQQGDLIFLLKQQDSARGEIAALMQRGNLLDRATPVRNMVGALAIAKQLDFRQTYDAYRQLNDDARAHLTFENFTALKAKEKEVIERGEQRVPVLLDAQAELDRSIAANEAARRRNRGIGLASSILSSFLLLLANLITERKKNA